MQTEDFSAPDDDALPPETKAPSPARGISVPATVLAADGTDRPLSRTQKKFKQLLERLNAQRQEVERWKAFRLAYDLQLDREYRPLAARLREKRIALVLVFDKALDGTSLRSREREKVQDILRQLITLLLTEAKDPLLVKIYDKYAEVKFAAELRDRMEALKAYASQEFGVDVSGYDGEESTEDLTEWLGAKVREAQRQAELEEPVPKKKGAKALEREVLKEQAIENSARAIRDIFRKLVSELHPDREPDPVERARKTELMQRVNRAYKAADLLELLELQIGIAQIDPAALVSLADEQLQRYIRVLEKQSKQLTEDIATLTRPLSMSVVNSKSRKITPDLAQRALREDVRQIKEIMRSVEADLVRFQNIARLKDSLSYYQIAAQDDLDDLESDAPKPRGRRSRRR